MQLNNKRIDIKVGLDKKDDWFVCDSNRLKCIFNNLGGIQILKLFSFVPSNFAKETKIFSSDLLENVKKGESQMKATIG